MANASADDSPPENSARLRLTLLSTNSMGNLHNAKSLNLLQQIHTQVQITYASIKKELQHSKKMKEE